MKRPPVCFLDRKPAHPFCEHYPDTTHLVGIITGILFARCGERSGRQIQDHEPADSSKREPWKRWGNGSCLADPLWWDVGGAYGAVYRGRRRLSSASASYPKRSRQRAGETSYRMMP